ncbi:VTC domain-containing protein [Nocardioides jiangxiensis]|uniref:VTC domain-containing protein n=1 Tax=Nocardioides jiangxiensis TaxID=3064524 RepID=A0ABT9B2E5_9ACTN|nr:VTC domain-containing protein [Nocardioides sp. WY-20]MDO7869014.1 VTC domain-containing protein [Nocardioides sp. WY-20]
MLDDPLGLAGHRRIGLEAVLDRAALLERTDRKYVVRRETARELVGLLAGSHHVLAVNGRTATTYRTRYLDTEDLLCVREHIQRRRRRFKARSRLYVEDGLCRFEVKTKDRRGGTVKVQSTVEAERFGAFGAPEAAFLADALDDAAVPHPGALQASVDMTYRRATLVDLDGRSRLTIDSQLVATGRSGGRVRLDAGHVLVETKSPSSGSLADAVLRELGQRPRSFSKYAATAALLDASIPANDFRRLVGVALHLEGPSA